MGLSATASIGMPGWMAFSASRMALSGSAATDREEARPKATAANRRLTRMETPGDIDQRSGREDYHSHRPSTDGTVLATSVCGLWRISTAAGRTSSPYELGLGMAESFGQRSHGAPIYSHADGGAHEAPAAVHGRRGYRSGWSRGRCGPAASARCADRRRGCADAWRTHGAAYAAISPYRYWLSRRAA